MTGRQVLMTIQESRYRRRFRTTRSGGSARHRFPRSGHVRYVDAQVSPAADSSSVGKIQEANGFDLLGRRRLHQAVNDLNMARGFLAEANPTTSGHQFHTAILTSNRVRVAAEGADTLRYHHVLGWARLLVPGAERSLEVRHLHLGDWC